MIGRGRLRRNPADFWVSSNARSFSAPRWRELSVMSSGSIAEMDSPLSTASMSAFMSGYQ